MTASVKNSNRRKAASEKPKKPRPSSELYAELRAREEAVHLARCARDEKARPPRKYYFRPEKNAWVPYFNLVDAETGRAVAFIEPDYEEVDEKHRMIPGKYFLNITVQKSSQDIRDLLEERLSSQDEDDGDDAYDEDEED